jgi:hypothetical protein
MRVFRLLLAATGICLIVAEAHAQNDLAECQAAIEKVNDAATSLGVIEGPPPSEEAMKKMRCKMMRARIQEAEVILRIVTARPQCGAIAEANPQQLRSFIAEKAGGVNMPQCPVGYGTQDLLKLNEGALIASIKMISAGPSDKPAKRDDVGRDANEKQADGIQDCISVLQDELYGGFYNRCEHKLYVSYCLFRPSGSSGKMYDCEQQKFGLVTAPAKRKTTASTNKAEVVHSYACIHPATPRVVYEHGRVKGHCKK